MRQHLQSSLLLKARSTFVNLYLEVYTHYASMLKLIQNQPIRGQINWRHFVFEIQ